MYPSHLIEHLEANPQIEEIHFNSEGEWVFRPRKTHLDTKTRAQVLGFRKTAGITLPPPVEESESKEVVSEDVASSQEQPKKTSKK